MVAKLHLPLKGDSLPKVYLDFKGLYSTEFYDFDKKSCTPTLALQTDYSMVMTRYLGMEVNKADVYGEYGC